MRNKIISFLFLLSLSAAFVACNGDELDSTSVIKDKHIVKNELDKWLDENYRKPYNLNFIYRMEDGESDMKFNLTPVDYEKAGILAKAIKHVWFAAYDEVAGKNSPEGSNILRGSHFMRQYSPRIIHLIGSGAYEDKTRIMGTAEGGLKVVLYFSNEVNLSDLSSMNSLFFRVLHHEFAHILHQTHDYPTEYNALSAGNYAPSSWFNRQKPEDYIPLGFVTAYAGSQGREDIAELTACYITYTDDEWKSLLQKAKGTKGYEIILKKTQLVKEYMLEYYGIDMDDLRKAVARRCAEIELLQAPTSPLKESGDAAITHSKQLEKLYCLPLAKLPQFRLKNINIKQNQDTQNNVLEKCCH